MTAIEACLKIHSIAAKELGTHEVVGEGTNGRIILYNTHTDLKSTDDSVPWCSSFANFVVDAAGLTGTHSAAARSWLDWGKAIEQPVLGCIVIFRRGNDPASGHVAFCDHPDISNGIIRVLGGNQGDHVKVSRFPAKDVLGYRWPEGVK